MTQVTETVDSGPIAYTIPAFCQVIGLGKSKVYEMIKERRLKTGILEGRRIVPASEAKRLLALALEAGEDEIIKPAPSRGGKRQA